jgi:hypothetical protein
MARRSTAIVAAMLVCALARAADRGCDVVWSDSTALGLVRLDETSAALTRGSLVIARARLGPVPALLQAMQPDVPLDTTVLEEVPGGWHIRGSIQIDDECTLDLDGDVALEPRVAPVARAAQALALLGAAQRAADDAQTERAGDLGQQALETLGPASAQPVPGATITAFVIERLIEQRQLGRALQLERQIHPQWQGRLDRAQPAALRFELAAARLLAWPEALAERERLQPLLDETFGARSLPAIENRVRHANALLVLGQGEAALAAFARAEALLNDDPRPAASLRILLARSHANALALQGRQDAQIARLQTLRDDLTRRFGTQDRRVIDIDDDIARGLADAARLPEPWRLRHGCSCGAIANSAPRTRARSRARACSRCCTDAAAATPPRARCSKTCCGGSIRRPIWPSRFVSGATSRPGPRWTANQTPRST